MFQTTLLRFIYLCIQGLLVLISKFLSGWDDTKILDYQESGACFQVDV